MKMCEVRDEFTIMAKQLDHMGLRLTAARMRYLVGQMHRRPPVRRAAPRKRGVPAQIIRAYAVAHPLANYMDIAMSVGTNNIARVSEAIAGKRS